jgi:thiopeptide-type bacteriocin biosynthesis protein
LVIDRSDEIEFEQLYHLYKREARLVLREVIGADEPEGLASLDRHEIILPFTMAGGAAKSSVAGTETGGALIPWQRDLSPAPMAEVVYAQVFLPAAATDRFLLEVCVPFIADLRRRQLALSWFYIRYNENGHQVRLRIFVADADAHATVSRELMVTLDRLQQQKALRNFIFARYEREVIRYGGPELMDLSEQLFAVDSDIALATLGEADKDEQRWRLALWACNALLEDAGLTLDARHRVVARLAANFRAEFRVGSYQRQLLGKEFRQHAPQLLAMLAPAGTQPSWVVAYDTAARSLRQGRRAVIARARATWDESIATQFDETLNSHLHMTCNRLFRVHARAHEVLVYDALERSYRAAIGRAQASRGLAA